MRGETPKAVANRKHTELCVLSRTSFSASVFVQA